MEASAILKYLTLGENVCVEFKRGGNGFEDDTLQTVCSFLNRFGGDIFLGITDTGEICGVPEKAAPDMVKNFIKRIGDTNLFSPTVLLVPEILQYEEKNNHSCSHSSERRGSQVQKGHL
jgi:ATP-dependent DNA helicase RecG